MKPDPLFLLWPWVFTLVLVFLRVSFFLFFMPLIGSVVPVRMRAVLSLVLALSLVFVVPEPLKPPASVLTAGGMMVSEALLGAALAFLLRVIFAGIQLGGELVGMQIGFGVAQVIDPVTGVQAPLLAQLTYLLAFLLFLAFDLHHPFFWALGEGLRILPPGSLKPRPELFQYLVGEGRVLFEVSLKILAPLLAFMLLLQLALGVVSRFVPQINIMIVSFPLTVGLGLFFFGLTLALVPKLLSPAFERALLGFRVVVRALGG